MCKNFDMIFISFCADIVADWGAAAFPFYVLFYFEQQDVLWLLTLYFYM